MESRDNLDYSENDDEFVPGANSLVDDKYRIERLIGRGGMGSVYEATQVSIGRQVAIKILHSSYADDRSMIDRFHREASAVSAISNDNICEVTDFGLTDNHIPYLVMPLLKGVSLADALDSQKIHINRLQDIVRQILNAVQAAHNAYIIHRDLKPENVIITQVGDRIDFVKLLDFGISGFIKPDGSSALRLTDTGLVLGTALYMAPEQATGSRWIDHRVDIYSVGVILYEALTGRLPYSGGSYNEIMHRIATLPFTAPRILNPEIPDALEQILLKSMQRDPAARYASADEMRQELENIELGDFYLPDRSEKSSRDEEVSQTEMIDGSSQIDDTQFESRDFVFAPHRPNRLEKGVISANKLLLALVAVVIAFATVFVFFHFSKTPSSVPDEARKTEPIQTESKVMSKTKEAVRDLSTGSIEKKPADVEDRPAVPQIPNTPTGHNKSGIKKKAVRLRPARVGSDQIRSIERPAKSIAVSDKETRNNTPKEIKGRFGTVIYSEYE